MKLTIKAFILKTIYYSYRSKSTVFKFSKIWNMSFNYNGMLNMVKYIRHIFQRKTENLLMFFKFLFPKIVHMSITLLHLNRTFNWDVILFYCMHLLYSLIVCLLYASFWLDFQFIHCWFRSSYHVKFFSFTKYSNWISF